MMLDIILRPSALVPKFSTSKIKLKCCLFMKYGSNDDDDDGDDNAAVADDKKVT